MPRPGIKASLTCPDLGSLSVQCVPFQVSYFHVGNTDGGVGVQAKDLHILIPLTPATVYSL